MESNHQAIYEQISARGLVSELLTKVRVHRPKVSRNTIYLAFDSGPTTPTRRLIINIANEILQAATLEAAA